MGGRIEGAGMNLKGVPTVTVVFGQWNTVHPVHVVGIFNTEEKAVALVKEEEARTEHRRLRVWHETFFVQ